LERRPASGGSSRGISWHNLVWGVHGS
jgi:hypothetical protein